MKDVYDNKFNPLFGKVVREQKVGWLNAVVVTHRNVNLYIREVSLLGKSTYFRLLRFIHIPRFIESSFRPEQMVVILQTTSLTVISWTKIDSIELGRPVNN